MSRTILIVDDDRALRKLFATHLSALGCLVYEAGSAREGQRVLESHEVDLAIIDGLLPDKRGVQWISQLREQGNTVPIVFISAYWRDLSTYRRLTEELSVVLVLYKPIRPEHLTQKLAPVLASLPERAPDPASENILIDVEFNDPEQTVPAVSRSELPDLSDLIEEYGATLLARVEELRELIAASTERPSALGEAIERAHRIRGSAGSYGFPSVSTAVGELEDLLVDMQARGVSVSANAAAVKDVLERALYVTRRALEGDASASVPPAADRLLVVAEDASLAGGLERMLREHMVTVVSEREAQAAFERARTAPPAAVLVDLEADSERALAFVKALRADKPKLPIAVVGTEDTMEARLLAARAGANVFVAKPLATRDFDALLAELLIRTTAMRERALVIIPEAPVLGATIEALQHESIDARGLAHAEDLLLSLAELRPHLLLIDERVAPVPLHELGAALALTPRYRDIILMALTREVERPVSLGHTLLLSRTIERAELVALIRGRLCEKRAQSPRLGLDV